MDRPKQDGRQQCCPWGSRSGPGPHVFPAGSTDCPLPVGLLSRALAKPPEHSAPSQLAPLLIPQSQPRALHFGKSPTKGLVTPVDSARRSGAWGVAAPSHRLCHKPEHRHCHSPPGPGWPLRHAHPVRHGRGAVPGVRPPPTGSLLCRLSLSGALAPPLVTTQQCPPDVNALSADGFRAGSRRAGVTETQLTAPAAAPATARPPPPVLGAARARGPLWPPHGHVACRSTGCGSRGTAGGGAAAPALQQGDGPQGPGEGSQAAHLPLMTGRERSMGEVEFPDGPVPAWPGGPHPRSLLPKAHPTGRPSPFWSLSVVLNPKAAGVCAFSLPSVTSDSGPASLRDSKPTGSRGARMGQRGRQSEERDSGSALRGHRGAVAFALEVILKNLQLTSPQKSVPSGELGLGMRPVKPCWCG